MLPPDVKGELKVRINNVGIEKLMTAGAKRWTKGDMDRLYINIGTLEELGEICGVEFHPSRQIRNFGKVYVDLTKDNEVIMKNLTEGNIADVVEIINKVCE